MWWQLIQGFNMAVFSLESHCGGMGRRLRRCLTFWCDVMTWWMGTELFTGRSLVGPGVVTQGRPIHVGASSIAAHKGLRRRSWHSWQGRNATLRRLTRWLRQPLPAAKPHPPGVRGYGRERSSCSLCILTADVPLQRARCRYDVVMTRIL